MTSIISDGKVALQQSIQSLFEYYIPLEAISDKSYITCRNHLLNKVLTLREKDACITALMHSYKDWVNSETNFNESRPIEVRNTWDFRSKLTLVQHLKRICPEIDGRYITTKHITRELFAIANTSNMRNDKQKCSSFMRYYLSEIFTVSADEQFGSISDLAEYITTISPEVAAIVKDNRFGVYLARANRIGIAKDRIKAEIFIKSVLEEERPEFAKMSEDRLVPCGIFRTKSCLSDIVKKLFSVCVPSVAISDHCYNELSQIWAENNGHLPYNATAKLLTKSYADWITAQMDTNLVNLPNEGWDFKTKEELVNYLKSTWPSFTSCLTLTPSMVSDENFAKANSNHLRGNYTGCLALVKAIHSESFALLDTFPVVDYATLINPEFLTQAGMIRHHLTKDRSPDSGSLSMRFSMTKANLTEVAAPPASVLGFESKKMLEHHLRLECPTTNLFGLDETNISDARFEQASSEWIKGTFQPARFLSELVQDFLEKLNAADVPMPKAFLASQVVKSDYIEATMLSLDTASSPDESSSTVLTIKNNTVLIPKSLPGTGSKSGGISKTKNELALEHSIAAMKRAQQDLASEGGLSRALMRIQSRHAQNGVIAEPVQQDLKAGHKNLTLCNFGEGNVRQHMMDAHRVPGKKS